MDVIKKAIVDWLREILIGGIISNLSGMFDSVNEKVGEAIVEVGKSPSAWNSSIFNMVQNLSETVMIPIGGVILAFVMTLELIQLVTDRNNLHDIDTWMFFKWSFKTAAAVLIVTNTWNIVMGIFDAAQSVVNSAGGVIVSDASIDISSVVADLETRLAEMELGPLFIIDGGHNPQCIEALVKNIDDYLAGRPLTVLTGVLGDKDFHCMYANVAPFAKEFITVTPGNPRALDAKDLAKYLATFGKPVTPCETVADGVKLAVEHAGKDGVVLCYGSLYMLGDIKAAVAAL